MGPPNYLLRARQRIFTGRVFISTPRTPGRRTHRCKFHTARGPQDPLTTAVLFTANLVFTTSQKRARGCAQPMRFTLFVEPALPLADQAKQECSC